MSKKKSLLFLLIIPALVLGACSKGNSKSSGDSSNKSSDSSSEVSSTISTSSLSESSLEPSSPSSSMSSASKEESSSTPISSSSEEPSSSSVPQISSSSEQSSSSIPQSNSSSVPSSSSSSSSSSSAPVDDRFHTDVTVKLAPSLNKERTEPYELSFVYSDSYFLKDATEYDKDLSLLSFGASAITEDYLQVKKFFETEQFEDYTPFGYDSEPTADSVGYTIAHKEIDDSELFAVTIRGFGYGMEWANNFLIGRTGDHEGFIARANDIYTGLQSYISDYIGNKSIKLWITGYSRGGAIANALSSLILKNKDINVEQDDMFVYTFEAPASLCEENAVAYENVHNITNKADLIASIPPESYGLKRCGIDHQIYDANLSTLLKEFDEEIEFPEFVPMSEDILGKEMKDDSDLHDFVLGSVFNVEETSEDKTIYANTREQYVDNYQEGLSSAIGYVFAMKESTRSEVLAAIQALGIGALGIIGDQTGKQLADFIKPYLTKDGIAFEDEKLQSDCAVLVKAVGNLFIKTLLIYMMNDYSSNLTRIIGMHYSETVYVLLKNAHSN